MKQRDPQRQPPSLTPKNEKDIIRQVRRYKVITPLFGGGAIPQQPDEVTVIRASEIRGLLRFWWRATRGGQFNGSLDAMRKAEEAIWGSAAGKDKAGPSPISLEVRILNRGRDIREVTIRTKRGEKTVHIGHPSSPYGYVAFPLQERKGSVRENIEFELHITINTLFVRSDGRKFNLREEVEAALWAWETFGGIGARTRRGFGALQLTKVDGTLISVPAVEEINHSISQGLSHYIKGDHWPKGVPHLHPTMMWVTTNYKRNPDEAWKHLFTALKEFRQVPLGRVKPYRHPDGKVYPGRSKWPEPDAIRRLTNTHSPSHAPQHLVTNKFPRGRFGLPIIFQFKDVGDPPKTVLVGSEHDRFASRLILRPLACQGGAVGLACVLQGPVDPLGGYELKMQNSGQVIARVEAKLEPQEAQQIEPLSGEPDVLKAFLDFLNS